MASSFSRRVVLAACLTAAVAAPGTAGAESKKVLVLPFEGELEPGAPEDGLEQLTAVVARSSGLTGAEVNIGQASFSDTATLVGCSAADADCLGKVAASLRVDQVVIGVVESSGGAGSGDAGSGDAGAAEPATVTVKLKLFRDGKVAARTLELPAPSFSAVLEGVARDAPALFVAAPEPGPGTNPEEGPEPKPDNKKPTPPPGPGPSAAPPPASPDPRVQPVAPPPRDDARFDVRRVHLAAWIAGGAGIALAGGGAVLLTMAHDRQQKVDGAPTSTADDLEHLQDLEDEGQRFTRIGDALLIGGGALVAVGGTLAVLQGLKVLGGEETAVSVAPVPLRGGGGIRVTIGGL